MKLNGETIKILEKELPWLPSLLWRRSGEFKVQVLDLDTLSLENRSNFPAFHIYLVTKNGEKIGEVSRRVRSRRLTWPFSWLARLTGQRTSVDEEQYFHETLEGALHRLYPASENLQFVLHVDGYYVTLYKVPKGMNFLEHMERKRNEADAQVVSFLKDN